MMPNSKIICIGLLLLLLSSFCREVFSADVGGWDVDGKKSGKPAGRDIKAKAGDDYPQSLSDAIAKFDSLIQKDRDAVQAAEKVRDTKVKKVHNKAEGELHTLLKSEVIRLTKANKLQEASVCKKALDNYQPGNIDWGKLPSSRIQSKWKHIVVHLEALRKNEQVKVNSKIKQLERNTKMFIKPVLREFDKLIATAKKAGEIDDVLQWQKKKQAFQVAALSGSGGDPSLVLFLTFDKASMFTKGGKTFFRDLSGHNHHCLYLEGKLVPGKKGEALQTTGKGTGGLVGNLKGVDFRGPNGVTLFARFYLPVGKQPALWFSSIVDGRIGKKAWCITSPGNRANSLMAGISTTRYWSAKEEYKGWLTVVVVFNPKLKKQFFFIDGKLHPKTHPMPPIKVEISPQVEIGKDFRGKIDEIRIYNRILSKKEIQQLSLLRGKVNNTQYK